MAVFDRGDIAAGHGVRAMFKSSKATNHPMASSMTFYGTRSILRALRATRSSMRLLFTRATPLGRLRLGAVVKSAIRAYWVTAIDQTGRRKFARLDGGSAAEHD